MDEVILIKLKRSDIYEFCECCKKFTCDIDIFSGRNILDAKDYMHVSLLDTSKDFCVYINSNSPAAIQEFNDAMNKYRKA